MRHQLSLLTSEQDIIPNLSNSSSEMDENMSNNKQTMNHKFSGYSLTKGKNESPVKEEFQILDSIDYSDDENILSKKVCPMNTKTIIRKNENRKKLKINELVEQVKQTEKYSEYFRFNYENFTIDEDLFIANALDDNNKSENTNSKSSNDDPLLLESDDWYYLNIVNTPKLSNVINNILPIEKNNELDCSLLKHHVTKKINRKIKVKVKKSKEKLRNQSKFICPKEKMKLQGKIIKRNIKGSKNNIQSTYNGTNFINNESVHLKSLPATENVNNISYIKSCTMESIIDLKKEPVKDISYKTEQVCIIKEETILPDCYVAEAIENLKTTTLADETTFIKIDYSKDDLKKNSNEIDQRIFSDEEKITNYYKCSTCGKEYERVGHFRRHQIICNEIRAVMYFECAMCPYKTKTKNTFKIIWKIIY